MGTDEVVERNDDQQRTSDVADRDKGGDARGRDDKPISVRDSIKFAIKSENEKEDKEEKEPRKQSRQRDEIKDKDSEEDKASDLKLAKDEDKVVDDNDETDAGDDDTNKEVSVKEEKQPPKSKDKPPSSLPKEVTDNWANIPSSVQQYITKSHKEISDQKAHLGRMAAHYRDMDAVVSQYEPSIRQLGVTPAQTVDRLFQWMNALAGPHKHLAIQQLAADFGIKLPQGDAQQQDEYVDYGNQQQQQQQPQHLQIPDEFQQKISGLESVVTQLYQQQSQARENTAAEAVNTWAGLQADGTYKNKPHFNSVRHLMTNLLQSGTIPLVNGRLDLDAAYEAACYAHPEVRALFEEERQVQSVEQAKAKHQQERDKVQKAKNTGLSIRPKAPVKLDDSIRPNNKSNGATSVRDSIKAAIREAANN